MGRIAYSGWLSGYLAAGSSSELNKGHGFWLAEFGHPRFG